MYTNPQELNWCNLDWSSWIPLDSSLELYQKHIPRGPGFYRVRSSKWIGLIYIGQTENGLRRRTRSLATNTFRPKDSPPWNDPHTAAPILWAYRIEDNYDFEISVVEKNLSYAERQCFEDYLIFCHRMFYNYSTLSNFGVAHPMWNKPSNKNAKQVRAMKRRDKAHQSNSLPRANNTEKFNSNNWLGLNWSNPTALSEVSPPNEPGIYKIDRENELLYCGESTDLKDRIRTHKRNQLFRGATISFCPMPGSQRNHLKEREVDMIGAYYEALSKCPVYQYSNNQYK